MNSNQSHTRTKLSSEAEVLEYILNCGTRIDNSSLQIRGFSTLGTEEITDFDFRYDCSNYIKREHTYISYPHESIDEILDVSGLEKHIQSGFKDPRILDQFSFLQRWAKARAQEGPSSTAGIYFEHTFQNVPRTAHIASLASNVAYGGRIQTRFHHDQAERRLLGFGDQWPPESQYCLHIRTVWRWTPDSSKTAPLSGSRPLQRWETVVQQAMVDRRLGLLTDENVPSSGISPQASSRKQSLQSDESWFDLTAETRNPKELWITEMLPTALYSSL